VLTAGPPGAVLTAENLHATFGMPIARPAEARP
jgi:hypothetical protein